VDGSGTEEEDVCRCLVNDRCQTPICPTRMPISCTQSRKMRRRGCLGSREDVSVGCVRARPAPRGGWQRGRQAHGGRLRLLEAQRKAVLDFIHSVLGSKQKRRLSNPATAPDPRDKYPNPATTRSHPATNSQTPRHALQAPSKVSPTPRQVSPTPRHVFLTPRQAL